MRIETVTKNFTLTKEFKALIEKKIGKFEKYFSDDADVKVVLKTAGSKETMEVTIRAGGKIIRSESTCQDMSKNIDIILPKIESQVVKHRTKIEKNLKKSAFDTPYIYDETKNDVVGSNLAKVVRIKNFDIQSMSVESAIEEMDLLGHNFYVFINALTQRVSVVYIRNDGGYGLLDPVY